VSEPTPAPHDASAQDASGGLVRWLFGGLAAGGVILGLLVAAYAIGYHRGQDERQTAARATASAPTTTTTRTRSTPATTTNATGAAGPVTVAPQLVARGKALFHSLTGGSGAGPPLNGLPGKMAKLVGGQTVTADDAYLERAITDPDAQIVDGYHPGIMRPAIAGFGLDKKPDDVRALVAFLKSKR